MGALLAKLAREISALPSSFFSYVSSANAENAGRRKNSLIAAKAAFRRQSKYRLRTSDPLSLARIKFGTPPLF